MDQNLSGYKIFYEVASCGNISKAAKKLYISQPAISKSIVKLEDSLDTKLFKRNSRGVTLTEEGDVLFKYIHDAFDSINSAETELKRMKEFNIGHIEIGVSTTLCRYILLPYLQRFKELYPNIRLRLYNHSSLQAISAIEKGVVDFSLVTTPLNIHKPLYSIPLTAFNEILIGGPKYRELAETAHHITELSAYPFISLGSGTGTRELYIQYFMNHGLNFHTDMEAATMDQILPMIQYDLGLGFYPEPLTKAALARNEICRIPICETLPSRQICLILNKSRHLSIAANTFLDILKMEYKKKGQPQSG